MRRARWVAPGAGAGVFLLLMGLILYAPAEAGRLAKGLYYGVLPDGVEHETDGFNRFVESSVDAAVRAFALGNPDKLIDSDLRLSPESSAPNTWLGSTSIRLAWTDLRSADIRYEVFVAAEGADLAQATLAALTGEPEAVVDVPGDGSYTVWVRPRTDRAGRASIFGPFWVDASAPGAPVLDDRGDPLGYRFDLTWGAVSDLSGTSGYDVERRAVDPAHNSASAWEPTAFASSPTHKEDQIGNGVYEYRVRARNGADVPSDWSNVVRILVQAPMANPGPGRLDYGIHANYTGFVHLWDLSDPTKYLGLSDLPTDIASRYLGAEPAIETDNATLRGIVADEVGGETNTLRIAIKLFEYLFNRTEYDEAKLDEPERALQRAGETLDLGKGICGDLAVLYVTLLRIAGVPARPVHGYLDNALSQIGGFHMWVEAYVGPRDASRPWLPVDVSGVKGTYETADLFGYFGVANPDYLALGTELDYDRYEDGQWNTWARFRYVRPQGTPKPTLTDRGVVSEYDAEYGRLYFNSQTMRTTYLACDDADPSRPDDPCPHESGPSGYSHYYGLKGVAKKRIDFGADVSGTMPSCLRIELRYPHADDQGAVAPDQSVIYHVYEGVSSGAVIVGEPEADGWVTFLDGNEVPEACDDL